MHISRKISDLAYEVNQIKATRLTQIHEILNSINDLKLFKVQAHRSFEDITQDILNLENKFDSNSSFVREHIDMVTKDFLTGRLKTFLNFEIEFSAIKKENQSYMRELERSNKKHREFVSEVDKNMGSSHSLKRFIKRNQDCACKYISFYGYIVMTADDSNRSDLYRTFNNIDNPMTNTSVNKIYVLKRNGFEYYIIFLCIIYLADEFKI